MSNRYFSFSLIVYVRYKKQITSICMNRIRLISALKESCNDVKKNVTKNRKGKKAERRKTSKWWLLSCDRKTIISNTRTRQQISSEPFFCLFWRL